MGRDVADDVSFLLWTRENSVEAQGLKVGDLNLLNSTHFNKNLPTKILVHGYRDTGTTGWVLNVKTAYLNKGKFVLCLSILLDFIQEY